MIIAAVNGLVSDSVHTTAARSWCAKSSRPLTRLTGLCRAWMSTDVLMLGLLPFWRLGSLTFVVVTLNGPYES